MDDAEARGLYGQCFQLAFDVAKKAERALQHELGDPSLSFIPHGYMGGKEGLFAGERLGLDLKRMEFVYLEMNRRELGQRGGVERDHRRDALVVQVDVIAEEARARAFYEDVDHEIAIVGEAHEAPRARSLRARLR